MTDDLEDLLEEAEDTPYGKARSAMLEVVARRAEAEEKAELAFYARLQLVTAYDLGGEPRKSLVPFARCVADLDADPATYGRYADSVLWCFKYVPNTLTKFPEVPLEQAHRALDEMERRWRLGGHSPHAVHQSRWLVADHVGDSVTAAEQFRLWSTAPRDDLSDCAGCDPTGKVGHLITAGRTADAVAQGDEVLSGRLNCEQQPQQILTALLAAYVAEGRYEEAADAHRRAYRALRHRTGELSSYAAHIRFCARTGNLPRALELIERHLPEHADAPSPLAAMEFAAAASHALSRLDQPVRRRDADDVPAGQLAGELADQATELAAQFDRRNGTTHQSEQVRQTLTAEPWVEYLPLTAAARRARSHREPTPRPEPQAALPEGGGDRWLDRAEEAWQTDRRPEALAAWKAFEDEVPEADRTPLDRARLLDGRGLAAYTEPDVALESWRQAITLYVELGEDLRVLRDRARIGRCLCEQGEYDEGRATGEDPLRRLIEEDEPRRRSRWRYSLAVLLMHTDRPDEALHELVVLQDDPHADAELLAFAGLMRCNLLMHADRPVEAEEAATAATSAPEPGTRSTAYRQRARARVELERPDEAASDLEEALALAAGLPKLDRHAALCRLELARAYLLTDRPLEAAETAEEVLPVMVAAGSQRLVSDVRDVLTEAYVDLGELEQALVQVRIQLTDAATSGTEGWLGTLRQQEGRLLEQLDRDDEAVGVLLSAAEHFEKAELPLDQVAAWRLAGLSARYAGDFATARDLLDRAETLLDAQPAEHDEVLFHRAGVHWDRAHLALNVGDTGAVAADAARAVEYYERGGFEEALLNARLLLAEHSPTGPDDLAELFGTLPTGHARYEETGYLLADRLRAAGRAQEADALLRRLEDDD